MHPERRQGFSAGVADVWVSYSSKLTSGSYLTHLNFRNILNPIHQTRLLITHNH